MRLCNIVDIKFAFMEKTDLSEEEIQTIIDDIPTAFDGDKVIEQFCETLGQTKTVAAERALRMYMDTMKQNPEQIMRERR